MKLKIFITTILFLGISLFLSAQEVPDMEELQKAMQQIEELQKAMKQANAQMQKEINGGLKDAGIAGPAATVPYCKTS